jgi:hypothetical protein
MNKLRIIIFSFFIAGMFTVPLVSADTVSFPTFSYEGEELQKVRQWEKTWNNKKITAENVDQVKDFVQEGVYTAIKDPGIFNAKEIWFEIVPYKPYTLSKGVIEATQKYSSASKLDDKEMLIGYGKVAGIPFPQPKTGIEMAWNFDSNTRGDSHQEKQFGTIVDCKTGFERTSEQERYELFWIGRYDAPPVPIIEKEKNPRGIARSFFQRMLQPADFIDTTILEIKYIDPHRGEDLWVYTSMFRRIRRYANNQRTDSIDGTDMIYDDQDGWYTHLIHNTYEYKGRADLLVPRHQDSAKLEKAKGQGYWNGFQRERANHWVVEVKNKDKNYVYSKQIWYLDPETWQMNSKVMYNRQGQLWKMYEFGYNEYPSYGGQTTTVFNSEHIVDFLRYHGSTSLRNVLSVGTDIPLTQFRTKALKEKSY